MSEGGGDLLVNDVYIINVRQCLDYGNTFDPIDPLICHVREHPCVFAMFLGREQQLDDAYARANTGEGRGVMSLWTYLLPHSPVCVFFIHCSTNQLIINVPFTGWTK